MVINYLPPNGVNCQTYPMLLDIGRRVQALCTTVSSDKPVISFVCVCVCVRKCEGKGISVYVCVGIHHSWQEKTSTDVGAF